ncbi:hypothetical protein RB595_009136 [Gaeumannomyces hyphopodioides]
MGDGSTGADDAGGTAPAQAQALQVIVLGSGGGPDESNTTAFLVRSLASGWGKGCLVAVDAGVHLGAINRILEATQPPGLLDGSVPVPHTLESGPFKGLELPHASPGANAAHVLRTLVDAYLITHPHLDHIAGFVINTAGLPGTRPKRLAGLPSTIAAFKTHIFNNVIWPNLSDENNGAGLVTYSRLVEGGSPALGDGDGRGYLEISDGLSVKAWGVSHGHCIERHSHRGSSSSSTTRYPSFDGSPFSGSSMGAVGMGLMGGLMSPRSLAHHNSAGPSLAVFLQQQAAARAGGEAGGGGGMLGAATPTHAGAGGPGGGSAAARGSVASIMGHNSTENVCVYDSSAYFVRCVATGREVLIFGDVEPDSVSLSPRNAVIWAEAAPRIAAGRLAAIFIECSYDDSQTVDRLFGHLTPRFVDQEMQALAAEVAAARAAASREGRKRKRADTAGAPGVSPKGGVASRRKTEANINSGSDGGSQQSEQPQQQQQPTPDDPVSPRTVKPPSLGRRSSGASGIEPSQPPQLSGGGPGHHPAPYPYSHHHHQNHNHGGQAYDSPHLATPTAELSIRDADLSLLTPGGGRRGSVGGASDAMAADLQQLQQPLRGLKVVIIHVKDRMDGKTPTGDVIMRELAAHEAESRLGVEYILSSAGQSLYF